ncbi:HDOD domain-containing protein [candidate division KSB1 bacterium]
MNDNAELKKIIENVNVSRISSIKQTLTEVINIINDPGSSAKDLKGIIEKDPPLSAKLLKMSNSAFYSYPREIRGIQEAIVLIGFTTVKELALSQKVCELFKNDTVVDGYSRNGLWKHCNAVAICSKLIFRREFSKSGENAYVAGLLHDLGIIVEDQFLQKEFTDCILSANGHKKNLYQMERENLGFDHAEIGSEVAKNWKFPDELINSINAHHEPDKVDDEFRELTMTLFVADYACQKRNFGYGDSPFTSDKIYRKYLRKLNINEMGMDLLTDLVGEELTKMEEAGWFLND